MDRGPQFPEEPIEPARNYDQEHYQGHHDRVLLGHQDACDMCRTEARNTASDQQVAKGAEDDMRASGVDLSDRNAVLDYQRDKAQKSMDELDEQRRNRGDSSPKRDRSAKNDPRVNKSKPKKYDSNGTDHHG